MPARSEGGAATAVVEGGRGWRGGDRGGLVLCASRDVARDPGPRAGLSHHPGHPRATWHGLVGSGTQGRPLIFSSGRGTCCVTRGWPCEGPRPAGFKGLRANVKGCGLCWGPRSHSLTAMGGSERGAPPALTLEDLLISPDPISSFHSYSFHTRQTETGPCSTSQRHSSRWEGSSTLYPVPSCNSPHLACVCHHGTWYLEFAASRVPEPGLWSQTLRKSRPSGRVIPVLSSLPLASVSFQHNSTATTPSKGGCEHHKSQWMQTLGTPCMVSAGLSVRCYYDHSALCLQPECKSKLIIIINKSVNTNSSHASCFSCPSLLTN